MSKVEAVILDWAGTTVDFGSFAPTTIFVEAFRQAYAFDITLAEARGPMGLGKWDHIRALGDDAAIAARWQAQFGRPMSDRDVDRIYEAFMPLQIAKVAAHADLIPGTRESVEWLRGQGIRIGSCSGYPREVMAVLVEAAAALGYRPDCVVATGDLPAGSRPGPWMALQNVLALAIGDVGSCVKVDDSAPGILEGRRAGMWTVGLSLSGNEAGLSLAEFLAAGDAERQRLRRHASINLAGAGAHYIVDTIADLPDVIGAINQRLARNERP